MSDLHQLSITRREPSHCEQIKNKRLDISFLSNGVTCLSTSLTLLILFHMHFSHIFCLVSHKHGSYFSYGGEMTWRVVLNSSNNSSSSSSGVIVVMQQQWQYDNNIFHSSLLTILVAEYTIFTSTTHTQKNSIHTRQERRAGLLAFRSCQSARSYFPEFHQYMLYISGKHKVIREWKSPQQFSRDSNPYTLGWYSSSQTILLLTFFDNNNNNNNNGDEFSDP